MDLEGINSEFEMSEKPTGSFSRIKVYQGMTFEMVLACIMRPNVAPAQLLKGF